MTSRLFFGLLLLLGNAPALIWGVGSARAEGCLLRYHHAATPMYAAYSGTESFSSCSACQQKVAEMQAKYRGFSGTCSPVGGGTTGSSVPRGGNWKQQAVAGLAGAFLQGFAEGMNQSRETGPSPEEIAAQRAAQEEAARQQAAAEQARREAEEREARRKQSLASWNKVQEEDKSVRAALVRKNQEEGAALLAAMSGEAGFPTDAPERQTALTLALLEPGGTAREAQPTRYEAVEERQTSDLRQPAAGRPEGPAKGQGGAKDGAPSALAQLLTLDGESRQAAAAANAGSPEEAKAKLDAAWEGGAGKAKPPVPAAQPSAAPKRPGKQKSADARRAASSPGKAKTASAAPEPSEGAKLLALLETGPAAAPAPFAAASETDRSASVSPAGPQMPPSAPADPCAGLQKDLERLGADAERLKRNLSLLNRYVRSSRTQFDQWAAGTDKALQEIDEAKKRVIGDCLIGLSSLRLADHLQAMEKTQADELGRIADTIVTAKAENPLRLERLRLAQQMARGNLQRIREMQATLGAQDGAVLASDMDAVYSKGGRYLASAEGLKEQIITASVAVLSLDAFKKYSTAVNPFARWWNTMKCGEGLIDLASGLSLHLLDLRAAKELARNQEAYLQAMTEQGRQLKADIDQIQKIKGRLAHACRAQESPAKADLPVTGRK